MRRKSPPSPPQGCKNKKGAEVCEGFIKLKILRSKVHCAIIVLKTNTVRRASEFGIITQPKVLGPRSPIRSTTWRFKASISVPKLFPASMSTHVISPGISANRVDFYASKSQKLESAAHSGPLHVEKVLLRADVATIDRGYQAERHCANGAVRGVEDLEFFVLRHFECAKVARNR
jgi:hypothetical protein